MKNENKIAITLGDPSGVGYEVTLKSIEKMELNTEKYILIGNKQLFQLKADELGTKVPTGTNFIDIPSDIPKLKVGKATAEGGRVSFESLKKAADLALSNKIQGIVTAPLSKEAMHMAGFRFSGQTEVLEKYAGNGNKAEMLFVAKDLRVLLLTRHLPLEDAVKKVTKEKITESLTILNNSLKNDFGVVHPRIAICGLNPHAGENGLLGIEENEIIIPTIKNLAKVGINIEGPYPADTIWIKAGRKYINKEKQEFDAFVACYHDQGLIPIKLLAMDNTVNTTINLSVIRTSPAHGTAYDIALKNIANPESMISAINQIDEIIFNKNLYLKQKNNIKLLQN